MIFRATNRLHYLNSSIEVVQSLPAGGGVIIHDSFSSGVDLETHTPDINVPGGSYLVTLTGSAASRVSGGTGGFTAPSAGSGQGRAEIEAGISDIRLTCMITAIGGGAAEWAMRWRFVSTGNNWLFATDNNNNVGHIYTVVGGVATIRASVAFPVNAGQWYNVEILHVGTSVTVTVNDTWAANYTGSHPTIDGGTRVGFGTGGSWTAVSVDEFLVENG